MIAHIDAAWVEPAAEQKGAGDAKRRFPGGKRRLVGHITVIET